MKLYEYTGLDNKKVSVAARWVIAVTVTNQDNTLIITPNAQLYVEDSYEKVKEDLTNG